MASLSPLRTANLLHRLYGFFVLGLLMLLAACGGPNSSTPGAGSNSGTPSTPTASAPSMTLKMSTTNVTPAQSATVTAVVLDGGGKPVTGAVVTFTTGVGFGTFSPSSGTALTDSTGTATVTLSAGGTAGASTLTASAPVASSTTTIGGTATASVGYQVSASQVTISMTPIVLGTGTSHLSAYGTTAVSVNLQQATGSSAPTPYAVPTQVSFTSTCASTKNGNGIPLASITNPVTTINGTATAQYVDNGCNSTDTITVSVATISGLSESTTLVVNPPNDGSIQFQSATPTSITLTGAGGAQTSKVVFKVLDQGGNPISAAVTFSLNTSVGGLKLLNTTGTSDPVSGLVATTVQAGSVPTPVRVTATIANSNLSTQSQVLSISTGLPDQAHFSWAAAPHNIEGWNYDGVTSTISMILSDHFGNPVPDNTTVNFISSGGSITPTCLTSSGKCSATLTSSSPRPTNGRVKVLAYAVGESCFTDQNGTGTFDDTAEFIDVNGLTCDLPDAFVDVNEIGLYLSPTDVASASYAGYLADTYIDFPGTGKFLSETYNANGTVQAEKGDGLYHGSLCSPAGQAAGLCCTMAAIQAGTCSISGYQPSIDVRSLTTVQDPVTKAITYQPMVIVFSGSHAYVSAVGVASKTNYLLATSGGTGFGIGETSGGTLPLPECGSSETVSVYLSDVNLNTMPYQTQVAVSTSKGSIVGTSSFTLGDNAARQTPNVLPGGYKAGTTNIAPGLYVLQFQVKDDGSLSNGVCTPGTNAAGQVQIQVTTQLKQIVTTYAFGVSN